jgi:hypothetical protein
MANAPSQFTPAQILEAGQRAEADGRFEHAKQFYRHIVEHHPHTREFGLARDGLGRLGTGASWADDVHHSRGYEQPTAHPNYAGLPAPAPESVGRADDYAYAQAHGQAAGWTPAAENGAPYNTARDQYSYSGGGQPGPTSSEDRRRIQIARAGYDPGDHDFDDEDYEPRKRYRLGRVLAGLMTYLGLAMLIGGGVVAGLVIAVPDEVRTILSGLPVLPDVIVFVGPALLVVGFFVCLIGQLARAVFDAADATRNALELQVACLVTRTAHARRSSEV